MNSFPRFFVRLKSGVRILLRAAQEFPSGAAAIVGGAGAIYGLYLRQEVRADIFDRSKTEELQVMTDHKLTKRELRFLQFASIEYDDVIYMSPMDFIDSLTLDGPRESKSAFKIAFLMFDEDNNGRIDKDEFLLVRNLTSSLRSTRKFTPSEIKEDKSEEEVRKQNTTLLMHLFGLRGDQKLSFDEFQQFYQNLQEELMEIEFLEFSRGKASISPVDFARLILRYTIVNKDDYHTYIQRMKERTQSDDVGVNLDQWALFSIFLNNLGEFQTAVRLYTNADMPVTKPEFSRAVQCTIGKTLDPIIVDMIFRIFDSNNDGTLSYSEFLAVMNDRLHRGLKGRLEKSLGWKPFKSCVISELSRQ